MREGEREEEGDATTRRRIRCGRLLVARVLIRDLAVEVDQLGIQGERVETLKRRRGKPEQQLLSVSKLSDAKDQRRRIPVALL